MKWRNFTIAESQPNFFPQLGNSVWEIPIHEHCIFFLGFRKFHKPKIARYSLWTLEIQAVIIY